ncbi:prephenate dehydrogenase [Leifsonia xyli subsp. cynodontis DSM 46306]|uniref:Prephenate/arogenate dehydrogenase domain-containing protein n=1 Tax=Leifsonia xyli subsp. cynodontis DSM 46306 TaxID=1389489 RepID=U3P748_LEIXC|nr:prephenate dehydrogenase [Leifsonia xyli]AGW42110.1 prephenate dehydrogenase [Leifsonia xyli subsp. cynodontis DSM 46306]
MTETASRLAGPVRVVGTGLLGASIGLGLRARGVDVLLADASPAHLRLAADYGAGRPDDGGAEPALVVVAVPPDLVARVVAVELAAHPGAIVTDVASVKVAPLAELERGGADLSRYVGSHPLAGREKGGPSAARADLFVGRPWAVAVRPENPRTAVSLVEALILDLGATPIELGAAEHDAAVALVSHAPQIVSSLMAKRLSGSTDTALGLAGQGVRDVTRIAGSEPELWVQILEANAPAIVEILRSYRDDLDRVLVALDDVDAPGSRRIIAEEIAGGNAGVSRLPGKHGQDKRFASLTVMVEDRPGELARLLHELGELNVNLEDLRLEHSPGAPFGLAEIAVLPEALHRTVNDLTDRGWRIAG